MKINYLYVFQLPDLNIVVILIAVAILAIGYGFYKRIKLSEKER